MKKLTLDEVISTLHKMDNKGDDMYENTKGELIGKNSSTNKFLRSFPKMKKATMYEKHKCQLLLSIFRREGSLNDGLINLNCIEKGGILYYTQFNYVEHLGMSKTKLSKAFSNLRNSLRAEIDDFSEIDNLFDAITFMLSYYNECVAERISWGGTSSYSKAKCVYDIFMKIEVKSEFNLFEAIYIKLILNERYAFLNERQNILKQIRDSQHTGAIMSSEKVFEWHKNEEIDVDDLSTYVEKNIEEIARVAYQKEEVTEIMKSFICEKLSIVKKYNNILFCNSIDRYEEQNYEKVETKKISLLTLHSIFREVVISYSKINGKSEELKLIKAINITMDKENKKSIVNSKAILEKLKTNNLSEIEKQYLSFKERRSRYFLIGKRKEWQVHLVAEELLCDIIKRNLDVDNIVNIQKNIQISLKEYLLSLESYIL